MIEQIQNAIGNMPPMPETVSKVQQACKDEETTVSDITEIIQHDPMLSANLLRAANSPVYGLSKEIKSLPQAVSLFGITTVSGLVMSYGSKKVIDIEPQAYGITKKQLGDIGLLQAGLGAKWAKGYDKAIADDLYVVALLSDLGKLTLAKVLEGKDTAALQQAQNFSQIRSAEKELTGVTTERVSAMMFDKWNFNDATISILNFFSGVDKDVNKDLKKVAVMLMIVKTCVNIKQQFAPEAIQKALQMQKKYSLHGLEDAIEALGYEVPKEA
ncbi:MAG: HDOD domain-containing protein [Campylobacterota bacterium]